MNTLRRIICWVAGHRWLVIGRNDDRSSVLGNLHSLSGCDADCSRCGRRWRDAAPLEVQAEAARKAAGQ